MTDREAARRAVRRAVEATQLGVYGFAEKAGIDPGTLGDFLDGTRWPQSKNRNKIERALGWDDGLIADLADGLVKAGPTSAPPVEPAPDIFAAIDADPNLIPEAKEHLRNQVRLLLRVQAADAPAAQGPHPADVAAAKSKLTEVPKPTRRSARTRRP